MKQSLGDRCKRYEAVSKTTLTPRVPVMARIDGRAFHTFTRGCVKPYDVDLHACMWEAALAVCRDIQGCQLAYIQSDEINLLITDFTRLDTKGWFDYEIQKMCSVAAANASVAFLVEFIKRFPSRAPALLQGRNLPTFDSRFYNVPREDVGNVFLWRQKDAERNSLSMLCQTHFSHKELQGKSSAERQDMLYEKGVNWNNFTPAVKRGVCAIRKEDARGRLSWVIDDQIPILSTEEGRAYIDQFLTVGVV